MFFVTDLLWDDTEGTTWHQTTSVTKSTFLTSLGMQETKKNQLREVDLVY